MKITHRYTARVTLEAITPFHIGAGWEGEISDAVAVTDANGLPALPGTSIAGVLRSLFEITYGVAATNGIFGFQQQQEGQGSRLSISWGFIHDSKNQPIEGLVGMEALKDDVLSSAMRPTLRDHVLIDHRGVSDAAKRGKFDELAVCAGHRFTFEIELAGEAGDASCWKQILDLLAQPELRLGGKTRRGFGCFKVVTIMEYAYDLREPGLVFLDHPVSLRKPAPKLQPYSSANPQNSTIHADLKLIPRGYWMFGGGEDIVDGEADMAPVRDRRIIWANDVGRVESDVVYLPGSAIKGALAHRIAYHFNAIKGIFADKINPVDFGNHVGSQNQAVRELFGFAKDRQPSSDNAGRRGIIMIDDVFIDNEPKSQLVPHVSIDRFTGGALGGALFSERPLWQGSPIAIRIGVDSSRADDVSRDARAALERTLDDLAHGKLQLGGGSGRGHGFFEVKEEIKWSDGGTWIKGGQ